MLRNPILPEAFDILLRAVEPGTNGKAQPHNRPVEAERLVGMADGRAYSGGHKKAGSWLAQLLRDDGYSFAETETALQSFRGRYPDYTDKEMRAALNAAYSPANGGQTKKVPKAKPHLNGASTAGECDEANQATVHEQTAVDPAQMVADVERFIRQYAVLPAAAYLPLAIWVIGTHIARNHRHRNLPWFGSWGGGTISDFRNSLFRILCYDFGQAILSKLKCGYGAETASCLSAAHNCRRQRRCVDYSEWAADLS